MMLGRTTNRHLGECLEDRSRLWSLYGKIYDCERSHNAETISFLRLTDFFPAINFYEYNPQCYGPT